MAVGVKTGGRAKGTPNRMTKELREVLKAVLYEEINNIPDLLNGLTPKERIDALIRLAPYVLPKVYNVSMSTGEDFTGDY